MKQGRELSLHGDRDDRVIDEKKSILYGTYILSVHYFRARSISQTEPSPTHVVYALSFTPLLLCMKHIRDVTLDSMCVAVCCISESLSSFGLTHCVYTSNPSSPRNTALEAALAPCHGRRRRYAPHHRRRLFAQDEEARCPRQHVPRHARTLGRARPRIAQRVDLGRGPRRRRGRAPHRRRPSPHEGAHVRMRLFFELVLLFFLVAGRRVTEGKKNLFCDVC